MSNDERDEILARNNDGKKEVTIMRRQLLRSYPFPPNQGELERLEEEIYKEKIENAYRDYYGWENSMIPEN